VDGYCLDDIAVAYMIARALNAGEKTGKWLDFGENFGGVQRGGGGSDLSPVPHNSPISSASSPLNAFKSCHPKEICPSTPTFINFNVPR